MKLKVFERENNKKAESYRKEGKIPGVIYGYEIKSTPVYALEKDFLNFYENYESGLFDLEFENKTLRGILQEVQFHPITDKPIHFDVYIPLLTKKIEAKVPLEFVGESPAVKKGGVLSFNIDEIEIEALPEQIPERIIVDISKLEEVGQSIYIKDLNLPQDIKVLIDSETPVVSVIEEAKVEEEVKEETTQTNA